jgi:hypothetical protein
MDGVTGATIDRAIRRHLAKAWDAAVAGQVLP